MTGVSLTISKAISPQIKAIRLCATSRRSTSEVLSCFYSLLSASAPPFPRNFLLPFIQALAQNREFEALRKFSLHLDAHCTERDKIIFYHKWIKTLVDEKEFIEAENVAALMKARKISGRNEINRWLRGCARQHWKTNQ